MDPSILVGWLNPLAEEGLISRERDAGDRRRHNISLTRTGHDRLTKIEREQAAAEDAYFAELEPSEVERSASCSPAQARMWTASSRPTTSSLADQSSLM